SPSSTPLAPASSPPPHLPSFPTRRSSDLPVLGALLVNAANTYLNDENLKAWAALALLAAAAGAIPPGVFLARRLQGLRGVLVGRSEERRVGKGWSARGSRSASRSQPRSGR